MQEQTSVQPSIQPQVDQRIAPRQQLLMRAGKLVATEFECVCIVRDVSATGLKAKLFQPIPHVSQCDIEFANGARFPLRKVWEEGSHAGFAFLNEVDLAAIIKLPFDQFPKRGLRINIAHQAKISAGRASMTGQLINISQNGLCLACDSPLPTAEKLNIRSGNLPILSGEVRWSGQNLYGIMLARPLTLEELAQFSGKPG